MVAPSGATITFEIKNVETLCGKHASLCNKQLTSCNPNNISAATAPARSHSAHPVVWSRKLPSSYSMGMLIERS